MYGLLKRFAKAPITTNGTKFPATPNGTASAKKMPVSMMVPNTVLYMPNFFTNGTLIKIPKYAGIPTHMEYTPSLSTSPKM